MSLPSGTVSDHRVDGPRRCPARRSAPFPARRTGPTSAGRRRGGRKFALAKAQVRLAQAAMAHRDTSVSALCQGLGIRPVTLYRYVGPQGELREQGQKVLGS